MEMKSQSVPLNYNQVIWRSLILYRLSFASVFLLSLLLATVAFLPRLLTDIMGKDIFLKLDPMSPRRLWLFAVLAVALIFFIAVLWRMHCYLRSKHEPIAEDLKKGMKKVLSVILAAFLQFVVLFGFSFLIYAFVLLVPFLPKSYIPSNQMALFIISSISIVQFFILLYVSTLFMFIIPLITIENKGVIKAIEKSTILVWNHWWRVFSVQITPWIIYTFVLVAVRWAFNLDIHIYFTDKMNNLIIPTLVNLAIFTLFVPWIAALLMTQLKDLEFRKTLDHIRK